MLVYPKVATASVPDCTTTALKLENKSGSKLYPGIALKANLNPSRVIRANASSSLYSVILPKKLLNACASSGVKSEILYHG
jgi:hypothetical protein